MRHLVFPGSSNGKRLVKLTPASLARARESGMPISQLEGWFQQRTGQPMPPAARLLLMGAQLSPPDWNGILSYRLRTPTLPTG